MALITRERRLVDIGGLREGDHLCFTYADSDTFVATLARFVIDGLARGHRVACFLPDDMADGAALLSLPGVADARARGALLIGSIRSAYLPGGAFDPDGRLEGYAMLEQQARADGFGGLSVIGEATEIINDADARARWPGYELRADLLAARSSIIAVCAYDLRRCDEAAIDLMRAVHATALGDPNLDPQFHLHATPTGSLTLGGEIDFQYAEDIGRIAGEAAIDLSEPVLDLSDLRFIDAAGMRGVIKCLRAIADTHHSARIRGAGRPFERVWELLGCARLIDVEFERP